MVYNCCLCCDSFFSYLKMKKINLAVTGCLGRMGQQIIKSVKTDKSFKLCTITENRKINKKINGIRIDLNSEHSLKKSNLIIVATPHKVYKKLKGYGPNTKHIKETLDYILYRDK